MNSSRTHLPRQLSSRLPGRPAQAARPLPLPLPLAADRRPWPWLACVSPFSLRRSLQILIACAAFLRVGAAHVLAVEPPDFAVEAVAQVSSSPPQIRLVWSARPFATGYTVSRKLLTEQSWSSIATLPASATSFTDGSVVSGAGYEYEIAQSNSDGISAYGYVYAGMDLPLTSARGRVVLVVDNTYAGELVNELARLQSDLVGDGWSVLRHDVARTTSPVDVKSIIWNDVNADPAATRAVLLFGHVAVPYSGDISPDLHPAHQGAWPADAYYGDMQGNWTDNSVYDTGAEDPRNHNVPGDGKFDQSVIPGQVSLAVGRVDLAALPAFAPRTEPELLRQYLNKNHDYRHRVFAAERRALIRDNFGEISGDAPATDAWRSFTPFFGPSNIKVIGAGQYFPTLGSESYLWSYAGGGGEYYQADGVGSTTDFAHQSPRCVFYMLHGSYFGDWDSTDNFLRAALASPGFGLAAAWTGLPHWFLHHMALGETIGFSTVLAQNNRGLYKNQLNLSASQVHIALMGDPTLRMHVVAPPANLRTISDGNGTVVLSWSASPDYIQGYYVYRSSASPSGPFTRLTRGFVSSTSYSDASAPVGSKYYMVRAVKLENSSSGSYYNPSQGIFASADGSGGPVFSVVRVEAANNGSEFGPAEAAFVISRTEPTAEALSVAFVLGGTAQNGSDYEQISSSGLIPAGQNSAWITIRPVPDALVEGAETVTLTLLSSGGYTVGSPASATVLIEDQPVNQPPSISAIPDQRLLMNAPEQRIPVTVSDPDTPVARVTLSATSSNPSLVPPDVISFSGDGSDRTLILAPARDQIGKATITVDANDGLASSHATFELSVDGPGSIQAIATQPDGTVRIQFAGTRDRPYAIYQSDDLSKWDLANSGTFPSGGTAEFLDRTAATARCRFYRIQWE